jgi:hypothetical protein
LLGGYLVSVAAVCGLLAINGPQLRAAAEAEEARVVEEENRRVCRELGMPHGTSVFPECVRHLREVRKLHGERLAAEVAGIL